MNTDLLIKHFGSREAAMRALGCKSRQSWWNWHHFGVPAKIQWQAEVLSGGKLKADRNGKVNGKN